MSKVCVRACVCVCVEHMQLCQCSPQNVLKGALDRWSSEEWLVDGWVWERVSSPW